MDWVSGLIILVLFILLVLAMEKIDEKTEEALKRLDSEFKELQEQYNALLERIKHLENKK